MSKTKRFADIFDGLKAAYGTYKIEGSQSNGKNTGKASVVREPRTKALWDEHLSGKGAAIGIIPINEENKVKWGCIDIDEYPLDHKELVAKIRRMKLPLVVCRSKSGGAHCYLFTSEWITAKEMQDVLNQISAALGYGGSEIFPKQVKLFLERGDVGNFLNLPYYDAEDGLRYAFNDDGSASTLDEFFTLYDAHVQTPEQVEALQVTEDENSPIKDGPPCLQTLCAEKISEGGRNNGLFSIGVYLRKAYPDNWEAEILSYNMRYVDPPLPLNEVNVVVKQLQRNDYAYKCKDQPIASYCNAELCKTRKFGIDSAQSGATVANLRKYNSTPPVWFLDVNGYPLELETEALQNQTQFQKSCIEQLNFMPRSTAKQSWEGRINHLLQEMQDTDGAIIEVSEDASTTGQFYEFLEEFCTTSQQAKAREEILLRRPYTDDEEDCIYFRLKDFENYLRKNKFTEFKTHKVAQRLRDINGVATVLRIKNKTTRVWKIPTYGAAHEPLQAKQFTSEKAPF